MTIWDAQKHAKRTARKAKLMPIATEWAVYHAEEAWYKAGGHMSDVFDDAERKQRLIAQRAAVRGAVAWWCERQRPWSEFYRQLDAKLCSTSSETPHTTI